MHAEVSVSCRDSQTEEGSTTTMKVIGLISLTDYLCWIYLNLPVFPCLCKRITYFIFVLLVFSSRERLKYESEHCVFISCYKRPFIFYWRKQHQLIGQSLQTLELFPASNRQRPSRLLWHTWSATCWYHTRLARVLLQEREPSWWGWGKKHCIAIPVVITLTSTPDQPITLDRSNTFLQLFHVSFIIPRFDLKYNTWFCNDLRFLGFLLSIGLQAFFLDPLGLCILSKLRL